MGRNLKEVTEEATLTSGISVPEKTTTKVPRLGMLEQLQGDQCGQSTKGK